MEYGLIYSKYDPAGVGIVNVLKELTHISPTNVKGFEKAFTADELNAIILEVNSDITECDFLDDLVNVKYYVMISKHTSSQGVKSFTTHHVGIPIHDLNLVRNISSFPSSNPPLAKKFLLNLIRFREELGLNDFVVSYEVTHHGPYNLRRPTTFIELGSSSEEWGLRKAQEVVAYVVMNSLSSDLNCTPTVGVGGNHYASIFTSRALSSDECFGHIIPNYVIKYFKDDVDVLSRLTNYAITYSVVGTSKVVIDSKVPSIVKKLVREVCSKLGLEVIY
jgi:D-aminoacyl-tRNA deacylase